jgi:hypothetical protein
MFCIVSIQNKNVWNIVKNFRGKPNISFSSLGLENEIFGFSDIHKHSGPTALYGAVGPNVWEIGKTKSVVGSLIQQPYKKRDNKARPGGVTSLSVEYLF